MTLTVRIRGERQVIRADNAYDLVGQLNGSSRNAKTNQRDWMKGAAARAKTVSGFPVRSDTAGHFVEDLLACGLLAEVHDD